MALFGFVKDPLEKRVDEERTRLNAETNARREEYKKNKGLLEGKSIEYDRSRVRGKSNSSVYFGSASFRGVDFYVDSIETEFGRRIEVHQFPFKNEPFSEDVGRLPRTFVVNAHVIDTVDYVSGDVRDSNGNVITRKSILGDKFPYEERRDALVEAIEGNSTPGIFNHPTMGSYRVVPTSCSVSFDNTQGRYESFRITFKEAGSRPPSIVTTTVAGTEESSKILRETSTKNTTDRLLDDLQKPGWIDDLLKGDVNALFDRIGDLIGLGGKDSAGFGEYADALAKAKANIDTIITIPAVLATTYAKLLSEVNNVYTNPFAKLENAFSLFNFNTSQQINSEYSFLIGGGAKKAVVDPGTGNIVYEDVVRTSNEETAQELRGVLEDYQKEILLVNLSELIVTTPYESSAQAIEYKTRINDAFDEMILKQGDSNKTGANDAYLALLDLKTKVNEDLALRIEELPNVREVEIKSIKPALVVAYNEYEDSTRYEEISLRNNIEHNLRIPIGEIEVIK